jgi:hypothetical protein
VRKSDGEQERRLIVERPKSVVPGDQLKKGKKGRAAEFEWHESVKPEVSGGV